MHVLTGGIVTSSTPCVTPSVVGLSAGKGRPELCRAGRKCSVDVCASFQCRQSLRHLQGAVSGRRRLVAGGWDCGRGYNDNGNPAAHHIQRCYLSLVIYLRKQY